MEKKPNVKIPMIAVIRVIIFLFIGLTCFVGYTKAQDMLLHNELFTVHDVFVEKSIEFIDRKQLLALKGKNIFTIDLMKIHHRIRSQYPQIAQLHIVKELPDHIKILAKKRDAVFAFVLKGKYLLVDKDAVAMYYVDKPGDLPMVYGPVGVGFKIMLGTGISAEYVFDALKIINAFKAHPQIARFKLIDIDLSNVSRYSIACAGGFKILLDKENYATKLDMLEALLSQRKIDFNTAKYVDLRFNEPVLGESVP